MRHLAHYVRYGVRKGAWSPLKETTMNFADNPAHAARNAPHAASHRQRKSVSTSEMSRYVRRRYPALTTTPDDLEHIIATVATALGRDVQIDGAAVRPIRPRRPDW